MDYNIHVTVGDHVISDGQVTTSFTNKLLSKQYLIE